MVSHKTATFGCNHCATIDSRYAIPCAGFASRDITVSLQRDDRKKREGGQIPCRNAAPAQCDTGTFVATYSSEYVSFGMTSSVNDIDVFGSASLDIDDSSVTAEYSVDLTDIIPDIEDTGTLVVTYSSDYVSFGGVC